MFGMVIERLVVLEVQKVSGLTEKKICAVGMIKLLTETPAMITGHYSKYWIPVLTALVGKSKGVPRVGVGFSKTFKTVLSLCVSSLQDCILCSKFRSK